MNKAELEAKVLELEQENESLKSQLENGSGEVGHAPPSQIDPASLLLLSTSVGVLRNPNTGGVLDENEFKHLAPVFVDHAIRLYQMLLTALHEQCCGKEDDECCEEDLNASNESLSA